MNNLLKKVVAGVSALTMCISVMPLSANAATQYQKGDVNGDRIVNSSDVLALNNFLHGSVAAKDAATAQRLDVNSDCIIDQNDYVLLKNINLGLSSSISVDYSNVLNLPIQETRGYYVVDAKTASTIDYYELKPVSNISTSSVSTCSIIGDDDRYLENGLNGVVALESGGTGFVVDKHTILTAAHCLCKSRNAILDCYKNIKIDVYKDNCTIEKSLTPVQYHIPSKFIDLDANLKDSENHPIYKYYDYALITVKEDLSDYVNDFNLGNVRSDIVTNNKVGPKVYATGFPCLYKGNLTEQQKQNILKSYPNINIELAQGQKITGDGYLKTTSNKLDDNYFKFTADTLPGNSGGPIYIIDNNTHTKTIIGIATQQYGSYNAGVRITTDILHFVYNNSNLNY